MKILVLCHGNINRSPACAAVLRTKLPAPDFEICSAALSRRRGEENNRAAKKMREAMAERGYSLDEHRSSWAGEHELKDYDVIIYMDGGNLDRLNAIWSEQGGEPKYPDVPKSFRGLFEWAPGHRSIRDPAFMARISPEFGDVVDLIVSASKRCAEEFLKK